MGIKEPVLRMGGITCNAGCFVGKAGVGNEARHQQSSQQLSLCAAMTCDLRWYSFQPNSDSAGKDALNGSPKEGAHDGNCGVLFWRVL